jgi:hypothetical protein
VDEARRYRLGDQRRRLRGGAPRVRTRRGRPPRAVPVPRLGSRRASPPVFRRSRPSYGSVCRPGACTDRATAPGLER